MIDLVKNPKQYDYFVEVFKAVQGLTNYRKFCYGGAIRGGKTFVTLAALLRLCKRFPGSKWHIIRSDFPSLQGTTIPSLEKIIRNSPNWKWNRDRANYFAYNELDSKIFFKGENIKQDPELTDFLGLETNGVFLEQLEELSQKLWDIALSRCGSWYIDPMPPAFMFTTLNPTQRWPKEVIYKKWIDGKLPPDFFYQYALPQDNAFVTQDQWNAWGTMDERYQNQFIKGDWTNFDEQDNRFVYTFNENEHVADNIKVNPKVQLNLSFDFNKNPITCFVSQHYAGTLWGIEQIKLSNSDIYKLCEYIYTKYGKYLHRVTGDATGKSSSALVQDNLNYYKVIKSALRLSGSQLKVPSVNPKLKENRVLVNTVFHRYKVKLDKVGCAPLIYDIQNVRVDAEGDIIKENRKDPTQQADCLDCFRYECNIELPFLLKI